MTNILIILLIVPACLADYYTVTTKQGDIKGTYYTAKDHAGNRKDTVRAFYGIPYAYPPLGPNSFEPPKDPQKETLIHANVNPRPACAQSDGGNYFTGDTNCLYLNIYTPSEKAAKDKLPVMIWIHGGDFNSGSGHWENYGADYLVQEGVILVTVNYRLGPYGFLSAPNIGVYGNMGLKDQRAALRWVNENIQAFGGDKNRITLFGGSAGAASIHYLMMDKSTKGLYQRVILQSGSALNPLASQFQPEERLKKLTNILKKDWYEPSYIDNINGLKGIRPTLLIPPAHSQVPDEEDKRRATAPVFRPVIEVKESKDPIINRTVEEIMETEGMPNVDIMMGFNSNEGIIAMHRVKKDQNEMIKTFNDVERVIPRNYFIWKYKNRTKPQQAIKELEDLYRKKHNLQNIIQAERVYTSLMGDAWFGHGIYRTLNYTINTPNRTKKTYFYKLSDDSYSINKNQPLKHWYHIKGVCHGDEIGYLFRIQYYTVYGYKTRYIPEKGKTTHRRLITMWTNFAKTGDPMKGVPTQGTPTSFEKQDDPHDVLNKVTWEPVEKGKEIKYLEIGKDNMSMQKYAEIERMKVWDKVYKAGISEHDNEIKREIRNKNRQRT